MWNKFLISFIGILLSTVAFARPVPSCVRFLTPPGSPQTVQDVNIPSELAFLDPDALDQQTGIWTQQIIQIAQQSLLQKRKGLQPPSSFIYRGGRKRRFSNAEAADKLRFTLFRALPGILDQVRSYVGSQGQDTTLEQILLHFRHIVESNYDSGDGVADIREQIAGQVDTQWKELHSGVALDNFEAGSVLRGATDYLKAFDSLSKRFSGKALEIFTDAVRTGGAFGSLGSRIILSSLGLKPASAEAILALTLLHPITDDVLDRGIDVGDSMKRIAEVLEGKKLKPSSPYEEVVFSLIGDIYESFSPSEHPVLQRILIRLHQAQLRSVAIQKHEKPDRKNPLRLLEITSQKGGLTALAIAYLSIGTLKTDEVEFFYKAGTLFQLGDDLMDIVEDQKDGTNTLWTQSLGSTATFRSMMQVFFDIQEFLETSSPKILVNNPLSMQLVNDIRLGFRFYLFASLLNRDLDHYTTSALKSVIPLSPSNIRSIAFSLFKGLRQQVAVSDLPEEEAAAINFYGEVFDRHFLNGAYSGFETLSIGRRARSTYNITDPNPFFLVVKFGDRCQELFRMCLSPQGSFANLRQLAFSISMFYAYFHMPQLIHDPTLHQIASASTVGGAMSFVLGASPSSPLPGPWRSDFRSRLIIPFVALGLNSWLRVIDIIMNQ